MLYSYLVYPIATIVNPNKTIRPLNNIQALVLRIQRATSYIIMLTIKISMISFTRTCGNENKFKYSSKFINTFCTKNPLYSFLSLRRIKLFLRTFIFFTLMSSSETDIFGTALT